MDITALISSSPIKSHPSTHIIDETIASVKEKLPGVPILVMQDGVRPEQEERRPAYEEYLENLRLGQPDVQVAVMAEHRHQARTTRDCITEFVDTSAILFIEHDMVLQGDIPVEDIYEMLVSGEADIVRLLYEDNDLINFTYMLREKRGDFTQTMQWSQRPHFARTDYYRRILNSYFSRESRTYIEDRMHGIVDSDNDWFSHRLWIYTPELPVNRFKINDGREDDFKYDGDYLVP